METENRSIHRSSAFSGWLVTEMVCGIPGLIALLPSLIPGTRRQPRNDRWFVIQVTILSGASARLLLAIDQEPLSQSSVAHKECERRVCTRKCATTEIWSAQLSIRFLQSIVHVFQHHLPRHWPIKIDEGKAEVPCTIN